MRRWIKIGRCLPTLALAAIGAGCGEPAGRTGQVSMEAGKTGTPGVTALVALSGPSPFAPDGCGQLDLPLYSVLPDSLDNGDGLRIGDESDPSIAVNPANPRHLVAAWQQDAALGIITAVSFDGGRSWDSSVVPSLTHCADMPQERVFHSRLSFGPDGAVYLGNEVDDGFFPDPRQLATIRVTASVSHDGGMGWETRYLDGGTAQGPKGFSTLTAEPDEPGAALVAWHTEGQVPGGSTFVSRTTDGGATWTRHTARQGTQADFPFNRIVALRDGTLLLFSADLRPTGIAAAAGFPGVLPASVPLFVQVSRDKAVSWSEPTAVATVRGQQWPAAVQAPDGSIYLSWLAPSPIGTEAQYVSRSDDNGATWTAPVVAVPYTDDIHPPLAVSADGHVGFVYTRPTAEDASDQRDAWLAYSTDRGVTWQQQHLAGPFTLPAGELPTFQETVGTPDGFSAVFLAGPPLAVDGATDVMYVSIRLKR